MRILMGRDTEKVSTWLSDFEASTYSQHGEDGIIEKILTILPKKDKWCVEFGAWDGVYCSNTRNLIVNKGYSAVLIESDKARFKDLQRNYSHNPKVTTINKLVGFSLENNLNHILEGSLIPSDFDFLSIDVDGNDYHIWRALSEYKPKLICIEFNQTIPTEVRFIQPANPSVNQGTSLLSLVELGKEKGYELVSLLKTNVFFVKSEYYPLFQIEDNDPRTLRTDLSAITYLFIGYDNRIFLRGNKKLLWGIGSLEESKIQVLPSFLRKSIASYNKVERITFGIHILLTSPHTFFATIHHLLSKHNCGLGGLAMHWLKGDL